jgi:hypothetical protein
VVHWRVPPKIFRIVDREEHMITWLSSFEYVTTSTPVDDGSFGIWSSIPPTTCVLWKADEKLARKERRKKKSCRIGVTRCMFIPQLDELLEYPTRSSTTANSKWKHRNIAEAKWES